jgi:hypothetical protein
MNAVELIIGYCLLLMAVYLVYHTATATFAFMTNGERL